MVRNLLNNLGRPMEVLVLLRRIRLSVSCQVYEVGDHFDADLQWPGGVIASTRVSEEPMSIP